MMQTRSLPTQKLHHITLVTRKIKNNNSLKIIHTSHLYNDNDKFIWSHSMYPVIRP